MSDQLIPFTEHPRAPAGAAPQMFPADQVREMLRSAAQKAQEKGERAVRKEERQRQADIQEALEAAHAAELARQRDEHAQEIARLKTEWWTQSVHMVRGARLWAAGLSGLIALTVGVTVTVALVQRTATAGADLGIEAMSKSRVIEQMLEQAP